MSDVSPSAVLSRRDLPWRDVAGEVVVLDHEGRRILGLNKTGGAVWKSLDGSRSLADVAAELASRYGRELATVEQDVLAFARLLLDRDLVAPAA